MTTDLMNKFETLLANAQSLLAELQALEGDDDAEDMADAVNMAVVHLVNFVGVR